MSLFLSRARSQSTRSGTHEKNTTGGHISHTLARIHKSTQPVLSPNAQPQQSHSSNICRVPHATCMRESSPKTMGGAKRPHAAGWLALLLAVRSPARCRSAVIPSRTILAKPSSASFRVCVRARVFSFTSGFQCVSGVSGASLRVSVFVGWLC